MKVGLPFDWDISTQRLPGELAAIGEKFSVFLVQRVTYFLITDGGQSVLGAAYFVLAFIPTVQMLIVNVVAEKSEKIKENMLTMGLKVRISSRAVTHPQPTLFRRVCSGLPGSLQNSFSQDQWWESNYLRYGSFFCL